MASALYVVDHQQQGRNAVSRHRLVSVVVETSLLRIADAHRASLPLDHPIRLVSRRVLLHSTKALVHKVHQNTRVICHWHIVQDNNAMFHHGLHQLQVGWIWGNNCAKVSMFKLIINVNSLICPEFLQGQVWGWRIGKSRVGSQPFKVLVALMMPLAIEHLAHHGWIHPQETIGKSTSGSLQSWIIFPGDLNATAITAITATKKPRFSYFTSAMMSFWWEGNAVKISFSRLLRNHRWVTTCISQPKAMQFKSRTIWKNNCDLLASV